MLILDGDTLPLETNPLIVQSLEVSPEPSGEVGDGMYALLFEELSRVV